MRATRSCPTAASNPSCTSMHAALSFLILWGMGTRSMSPLRCLSTCAGPGPCSGLMRTVSTQTMAAESAIECRSIGCTVIGARRSCPIDGDFFVLIATFGMRGWGTLVDAEEGSAPFGNFGGGDDHSNLHL